MWFLRPNPGHDILINNCVIDIVVNHNFLGIRIDSDLNFSQHVKFIISKLCSVKGFFRANLNLLPKVSHDLIFNSLVMPHVSYCNAAFSPFLRKSDIHHLDGCLKYFKNCQNHNSISSLFQDGRSKFVLKICHCNFPESLSSELLLVNHSHNTRLRGFIISRPNTALASRCFTHWAPRALNAMHL